MLFDVRMTNSGGSEVRGFHEGSLVPPDDLF